MRKTTTAKRFIFNFLWPFLAVILVALVYGVSRWAADPASGLKELAIVMDHVRALFISNSVDFGEYTGLAVGWITIVALLTTVMSFADVATDDSSSQQELESDNERIRQWIAAQVPAPDDHVLRDEDSIREQHGSFRAQLAGATLLEEDFDQRVDAALERRPADSHTGSGNFHTFIDFSGLVIALLGAWSFFYLWSAAADHPNWVQLLTTALIVLACQNLAKILDGLDSTITQKHADAQDQARSLDFIHQTLTSDDVGSQLADWHDGVDDHLSGISAERARQSDAVAGIAQSHAFDRWPLNYVRSWFALSPYVISLRAAVLIIVPAVLFIGVSYVAIGNTDGNFLLARKLVYIGVAAGASGFVHYIALRPYFAPYGRDLGLAVMGLRGYQTGHSTLQGSFSLGLSGLFTVIAFAGLFAHAMRISALLEPLWRAGYMLIASLAILVMLVGVWRTATYFSASRTMRRTAHNQIHATILDAQHELARIHRDAGSRAS